MSTPGPRKAETHFLHMALLITGGFAVATGLLNLIWSFGWSGGTFQSDYASIGFSGLDDIEFLPSSEFALPLIAAGVCLLVLANATAWQETDGY